MRSTLKLYHEFLFTKPVRIIYYVIIGVTSVLLYYFSRLYENPYYIEFYRDITIENYLYEGFQIIKIIVLLFVTLNAIYTIYIQKFDLYLYTRNSRIKVYLSKVVVTVFMNVLLGILLMTIFFVFYSVLDSHIEIRSLSKYSISVVMFITYYSLFKSLLLGLYRNIFVVLIPFIGYMIGNLSTDYGIPISQLEKSTIYIHLLFPDIILYKEDVFFVYGVVFVLGTILLLCLLCIKTFINSDEVM